MPHRVIIANLQKKIYEPFYLLFGEETYFLDKLCDYFQDHFFEDEAMKDFNQQVVYGADVRMDDIVSMAKEYPMMSEYRLVVVREAQEIVRSPGLTDAAFFAPLTQYLQQPQKQTLLVFCYKYGSINKNTAFFKVASRVGCVFESPVIYEESLPKYVQMIAEEKHFRMDPEAAQLIGVHMGVSLSRIDMELEKFRNILPEGGQITPQLIEEHIGISREYNPFEFANALLERNERKLFGMLDLFAKNPKKYPLVIFIPTIYSTFSKVLQYHYLADKSNLKSLGVFWKMETIFRNAVKFYTLPMTVRLIRMLKEYDLKSKGYNGCDEDGMELLKELSFRIIHGLV